MASLSNEKSIKDIVPTVLDAMKTDPELKAKLHSPQFRRRAAEMYIQTNFSHHSEQEQQMAHAQLLEHLITISNTHKEEKQAPGTPATPPTQPTPPTPAATPPPTTTTNDSTLASNAKDAGNVAFVAKEYTRAIQCYKQSLTYNSAKLVPTLHSNIAASCIALHDYEQAQTSAQACLALEPTNLKALYRLAVAQQHLGQIKQALVTLTTGQQLDDGLYSDSSKKKLIKAIRALRTTVLSTLKEIPIQSYSFADEGKPTVKVYIALKDVGDLPKDDITVSFDRMSMDLSVKGYNGQNLRLYAAELLGAIVPNKCKMKIKPNMIVVSLRKAQNDGMRPWEKLRR